MVRAQKRVIYRFIAPTRPRQVVMNVIRAARTGALPALAVVVAVLAALQLIPCVLLSLGWNTVGVTAGLPIGCNRHRAAGRPGAGWL